MKPPLYDILKTNDHAVMVYMVRQRLAEGWGLVGQVSTVVENGRTYLYQTLMRYPQEGDEDSRGSQGGGS